MQPGRGVLVRDLLTHSAGMPLQLPEDTDLRRKHAPLSEFTELAETTDLVFAPQTDWAYCNQGVLLAGAIVERLSGQVCIAPVRHRHRHCRHHLAPSWQLRTMVGPPLTAAATAAAACPCLCRRARVQSLRAFQQTEIFGPLGMVDSSLGLGGRALEQTVWCGTELGREDATDADRCSGGLCSPHNCTAT